MITEGFVRTYGKGIGAALWALLLGTLVMLCVLLLVATGHIQGDVVGLAGGAYFTAVAAIGGGTQLPNVAERLPGTRSWQHPPRFDGHNRRAADRIPDEVPRDHPEER